MREEQGAKGHRLLSMLIVLGLIYLISNLIRLSTGVMGSTLIQELGLSAVELGGLGSAFFYAYGLMQVPSGLVADRISPRILIPLNCLMTGICSFFFAAAGQYETLALSRIVTGLTTAFFYVPALTLIRRWFGNRSLGTMTGIFLTMGQIGSVTASLPFRMAMNAVGWRSVYMGIGCVSLVTGILAWCLIKKPEVSDPAIQVTETEGVPVRKSFRGVFGLGAVLLIVWFFVTGGTRMAFQSLWGEQYFIGALQKSPEAASVYLMWMSIGGAFGATLLGRVCDRWGSMPTLLGASGLSSLGWVAFALFTPKTPDWLIYFVCIFMGNLGAGLLTAGFTSVREMVGEGDTGLLVGMNNGAVFLGGAVFSHVLGGVFSKLPPGPGLYSLLFLIFFFLCFAAALGLLLHGRNKKMQLREGSQ